MFTNIFERNYFPQNYKGVFAQLDMWTPNKITTFLSFGPKISITGLVMSKKPLLSLTKNELIV